MPSTLLNQRSLFISLNEIEKVLFIFEVNLIGMACIPINRDILIFKFGTQVTGTAKICFEYNHRHDIKYN